MNQTLTDKFYVVAYEPGADNPRIPTWANRDSNPCALATDYSWEEVQFIKLAGVPAAFQLLNVLSMSECRRMIEMSESLGYLKDAAVSLPREIRHNDNVVWVTDEQTDGLIWQRVAPFFEKTSKISQGKKPLGLNARFRFYRYGTGDFFKFHSDGAWPGSRVIEEELVANAYADRFSMMTFLLYLNDNYQGGATRFQVNARNSEEPARYYNEVNEVDVYTPAGAALCFPHGRHPQHCIHSGETILEGTKYIIRTDVLYEL